LPPDICRDTEAGDTPARFATSPILAIEHPSLRCEIDF
jgi:hypothetical protein